MATVAISKLHHAEFGQNDHREDAPHFIGKGKYQIGNNRFAVLSATTVNGNVVESLHCTTNILRAVPFVAQVILFGLHSASIYSNRIGDAV